MLSFWSGSVATFLATPTAVILGALAEAQIRHFRTNDVQQLRAWEESILLLRNALAGQHDSEKWWLLLEYPMLRLGRRADAIILTPRAILVLECKTEARHFAAADREQTEDDALDLRDFHAGSRRHPIVPILVAMHAPRPKPATLNLPIQCLWNVVDANADTLATVLQRPAKSRLKRSSWWTKRNAAGPPGTRSAKRVTGLCDLPCRSRRTCCRSCRATLASPR